MHSLASRAAVWAVALTMVGAGVEAADSSRAQSASSCSGVVVDITDADTRAALAGASYELVGKPETYKVSTYVKISRADFVATDRDGKQQQVAVECTLTCSGLSCSGSGCDAWAGGCTSYSCFGSGCTSGSCTKKTTSE